MVSVPSRYGRQRNTVSNIEKLRVTSHFGAKQVVVARAENYLEGT